MRTFRRLAPVLVIVATLAVICMGAGITGIFTQVTSANGYQVNGAAGSSGQSLCSNGTYFAVPCSIYYQTINGTTQRPTFHFTTEFSVSDQSSPPQTNIDLATIGVGGTCTTCSIGYDTYGRIIAASSNSTVFTAIYSTPTTIGSGNFVTIDVPLPVTLSGTYAASCSPVSVTGINPGAVFVTNEVKSSTQVAVTIVTGTNSQATGGTIGEVDCVVSQ